MRRRTDPRGEGGFTLLEVMAAVAILALTLVVLLSVISNNMRATAHARATREAVHLGDATTTTRAYGPFCANIHRAKSLSAAASASSSTAGGRPSFGTATTTQVAPNCVRLDSHVLS